jgi:thiosulfate/3-mercaptopyruvate sulfurtransferase
MAEASNSIIGGTSLRLRANLQGQFMRLLLLLGAAVAAIHVQSAPQPVLVNGEWLSSRLRDSKVVVLHVAANRNEYDYGHIPGARFVAHQSLAPSVGGFSTQLPSEVQLDSVLELAGVSDGSHVILYGQPLQAARAFVTLEYAGLVGSVSILDGGLEAWREAGRAVSTEAATPPRGSFTVKLNPAVVADAPWIQTNAARPDIALLDARAPEFYLGFSAGQMPRAGHIPSAMNIPFTSLTSELTSMRDEQRLRRLFEGAGAARGDTVVTYCHVGLQASLLYFNARRLGYPAKIYDGSFEDWSRQSELPVVARKNR